MSYAFDSFLCDNGFSPNTAKHEVLYFVPMASQLDDGLHILVCHKHRGDVAVFGTICWNIPTLLLMEWCKMTASKVRLNQKHGKRWIYQTYVVAGKSHHDQINGHGFPYVYIYIYIRIHTYIKYLLCSQLHSPKISITKVDCNDKPDSRSSSDRGYALVCNSFTVGGPETTCENEYDFW